ncbi:ABC transporter permease [Aliifodinibius sp. S!AR15-10]|uniref:FtsX-like permease family protein n=1 Tax=Aliifodinibius sp. S!AR15-10 TaxID=2950437 RepID=UPI002867979F|nr:FtsX-like permease family protein [Aliifodinibius sp. S!AR15-10]MDR8391310.1 ABC transporter permease [Aliifodinibius sp. S!AR15-10]
MESTSYIARRYLFSRKHISLISTLTIISITGITIGTALLIVVLSVFNGFFDVIKGLLLSYDPDIRIQSATTTEMVYNPDLVSELESIPEVMVAAPYISDKALLTHAQNQDQVVDIRGIRKDDFFRLNQAEEMMTNGTFDLSVRNKQPGVVMSERQLNQFNLEVGDQVALLSAEGMRKSLTQFSFPRIYRFQVRGSYFMQQVVSEPVVYVDLEAAQRLFEYRNQITGIDLRLTNSDLANSVKTEIESKLGSDYTISTWYDLQKPLYDVMLLEKWGSYVILMIIVLVAVLNIVGSLTMIVIQKKRDIGILSTMGLSPDKIKSIFVKQGLYIGLIGCGIGGSLGLLLSWLQKEYGLIKLSSAFIIDAYPASIDLFDVGIILAGTLLLCLAASWYPAKRASGVEPAEAIRYE